MIGLVARHGERFALALLALFSASLFALPLALLARQGLTSSGGSWFAPLRSALADPAVLAALRHSVTTAGLSGLFALGVGAAMAALVALTDIRGKPTFAFVLVLPMMIPQHVTAIAWLQATGPGSPALQLLGIAPPIGTPNPLYSEAGILVLLTIQHAPLTFLLLLAALRQLPGEIVEAARVAGARPGRILLRVLLPASAPALVAAYALAVVSTLGNFGIPALLGIPARYITLPVLIWRRLASFGPGMLPDVAVLSALLGGLAIAAVAVQLMLQARMAARISSRWQRPIAFRLSGFRPFAEALLALYAAATTVVPVSALLATSLVPTYGVRLTARSVTLSNYAELLFSQPATLRAFANSTLLATIAALTLAALALLLAALLAGRPGRGQKATLTNIVALADVAYALPGIVIAIAYILAFLRPLPLFHLRLYDTLGIIYFAYLTAFFAIALKPVMAAVAQLDGGLDAAARLAGACFATRLRRILAPLIGPAAASGALIVFLAAYNEVTISALLWSSGTETLGTTIFNYEDGGYTTLAAAMAMLTVLVTLSLMAGLTLAARRLPRGILPWAELSPHRT